MVLSALILNPRFCNITGTSKMLVTSGPAHRQPPEQIRLVLEDPSGAEVRPDQPISFAERRFVPRWVRTTFISSEDLTGFENLSGLSGGEPCTSPD